LIPLSRVVEALAIRGDLNVGLIVTVIVEVSSPIRGLSKPHLSSIFPKARRECCNDIAIEWYLMQRLDRRSVCPASLPFTNLLDVAEYLSNWALFLSIL
jgi:hypothetical protein